jgi:hypothetical protein
MAKKNIYFGATIKLDEKMAKEIVEIRILGNVCDAAALSLLCVAALTTTTTTTTSTTTTVVFFRYLGR